MQARAAASQMNPSSPHGRRIGAIALREHFETHAERVFLEHLARVYPA